MPIPDKLSLVIQSDDPGRVHYAFAMAAAALAVGKPVTMLFAMEGARVLTRSWSSGLGARPAAGIASFEELLSSCVELEGRFMVCGAGLEAVGLAFEDLRDDVPFEEASAVGFLADASRHGQMLYV